jgi:hypothetical protein
VPLEARPDRPTERLGIGVPCGAVDQRVDPPGRHQHVVVDERDQVGARGTQARVPRRVEPAQAVRPHRSSAEALGELSGRAAGSVVHD